jgi:NTE family protein
VRLPKSAFDRLTRKHASLMRELARMMLHRLRGGSLQLALGAAGLRPDRDLADDRSALPHRGDRNALGRAGPESGVVGEECADWTGSKLDKLEADHDLVILAAKLGDADWARRAMGRADRIWMLARADAHPSIPLMPEDPSPAARLKLIDVVMLHHGGDRAATTPGEWVDAADAARAFHWRVGERADARHLARVMSGRSIGLALSGGGSRAYAHVGAIRALREAGVEFDFFCGASMGGIIAAGAALGWDDEELETRMRQAFVRAIPCPTGNCR